MFDPRVTISAYCRHNSARVCGISYFQGIAPKHNRIPVLCRLTLPPHVGIIVNMPARLLFEFRYDYEDGAIVEMVLWELPEPLPGSVHSYKYRLFYGYPGRRLLGYDNERGKGDHRHLDGRERPYEFVSVDRLMEEFLEGVAARRRTDANDDHSNRKG